MRNKFTDHLLDSERALGPFVKIDDYDDERIEEIAREHELNSMVLNQTTSNLANSVRLHPEAETLEMAKLIQHFRLLQTRSETLQGRIQSHLNRLANTLALRESRKSIEQSVST